MLRTSKPTKKSQQKKIQKPVKPVKQWKELQKQNRQKEKPILVQNMRGYSGWWRGPPGTVCKMILTFIILYLVFCAADYLQRDLRKRKVI
jgi:hypothetical protein